MEYRQAASIVDTLVVNIWLIQFDDRFPEFGVDITRQDGVEGENAGESIARARAFWSRVEKKSGESTFIPEALFADFPRSPGALLVRNFSTGIFLNLAGRPASPPEGMLLTLQFGRAEGEESADG